jgi:hypothetical protein
MLHAVRLLRVTDSTKIWRKIRVSGHISYKGTLGFKVRW